ncbi:hypothetical protein Gasu2_19850 [Galdieria sulphuraria]|uniref:Peroxin-13 n=1 Tax=Galdieria sulphuraria TaxID=130081 RepID=M2W636_GALSU|nr:uncharacterized protein Gasu_14690 [Galdieria sulphuraria]EME31226.1 hypothetical protein Gasu_14690 [Galdieria sulphuraria]GJD07636.1 hypothetical protein Gasu2_19850 [Galdieria sulphuraria]|eukprot:XP_005707746.1 hypothetical protein Gasu_14690 [Galdieria sulphuraria]
MDNLRETQQQVPEIFPRNEGTTNVPPVNGNQEWNRPQSTYLPEATPFGYNNNNNNSGLGSWFSSRWGNPLSGYGGNTYPYSSGFGPYYYGNGGIGNNNMMYGSPWGGGFPGTTNLLGFNNPLVQNFISPGQNMLASVQNAMQVFARFSGLMEETMRNLHLVFDSIFGLVQILGLLKQEMFRFVAPKSSVFQPVIRVAEKLLRFWKLFLLFLMSPLAGKYSPVSLVLKILGLVPEESARISLDESGTNHIQVRPEEEGPSRTHNDDQESNL